MRFTSAAGVAIEPVFRHSSSLLRNRTRLQTCVQGGQGHECDGIAPFDTCTRAFAVDSYDQVYQTLCHMAVFTQLEIV
jgi:hypothetical protein